MSLIIDYGGADMIAYHVTSIKKFLKYLRTGGILPPVRVWNSIFEAERFSKQTGRAIILRLKLPDDRVKRLDGHRNHAYVYGSTVSFSQIFNGWEVKI